MERNTLTGHYSRLGKGKVFGQHSSGSQWNKTHFENFLEKSTVRNTPVFTFMSFQSSLSLGWVFTGGVSFLVATLNYSLSLIPASFHCCVRTCRLTGRVS